MPHNESQPIPQTQELSDRTLSIAENLLLFGDYTEVWSLMIGGGTGSQRRAQVLCRLKAWAPELDPDGACGALSYGQRRLVELVRCFLHPGVLYLLDEPMAGLSPVLRERIARLIAEGARGGAAVVYAEHDPGELASITARTITLSHGIAAESAAR